MLTMTSRSLEGDVYGRSHHPNNPPNCQFGVCSTDATTESSAEVSAGTTIMAIEFAGGVVLAADSRTSAGGYVVNRASRKVSQLHHRIFVARSGSAADTQALAGIARRFLAADALETCGLPSVNTAASVLQLLSYENKNFLTAGLIVAGWDPRRGGQVYQIPLGGSKIRSKVAIGGSGSGYIAAFVDEHFREGMSATECIDFAKRSVALAMSLDGSSGGLIRLTVVTEAGVSEEVVIEENPL